MRRSLLFTALAAVALLAACTSSNPPAWTYAPPTPAPSAAAGASGSPAASGGTESTAPSGATASGAPSGGGAAVVQISASGTQFEQTEVSAPADTAFTIHFNNKDSGQPHNVAIKDASGMEMFKGDIVTGPIETDYAVPALAAGSYTFVCSVHANMTGTLKVGG